MFPSLEMLFRRSTVLIFNYILLLTWTAVVNCVDFLVNCKTMGKMLFWLRWRCSAAVFEKHHACLVARTDRDDLKLRLLAADCYRELAEQQQETEESQCP